MTSRANRKAALAKFKAAKEGSINALDDLPSDDEDDVVYDVVEEQEYQQLVQTRREREDFVVDDDGLGYYDDGEEHLGDEEDEQQQQGTKKRRSGSANATLTAQALKKARKLKSSSTTSAASKQANGDDSGATSNNRSMWDFVNRGGAGPTKTTTTTKSTTTSGTNPLKAAAARSMKQALNVDDLLGELDAPLPVIKKRRSNNNNKGRNTARSSGRARHSVSSSSSRHRRPASSVRSSRTSRRSEREEHVHHQYEEEEENDSFPVFDDDNDDDNNHHFEPEVADAMSTEATTAQRGDTEKDSENQSSPQKSTSTVQSPALSTKAVRFSDDVKDKTPEDSPAAPQPRRRLARPKLGQLSKPARQAQEQQKQEQEKATQQQQKEKQAPSLTTPSISFQPDWIASEPATDTSSISSSSSSSTAGQVDLGPLLTTDDEGPYLDMFWIDLAERANGDLLVFGKVAVPSSSNKNNNGNNNKNTKYISACAVVTGNVRNLFVLPKPDAEMMKVHAEINTLLHSGIVPHKAGASWAGKVVKRQYAFADSSVPREETDYLKVVYSSKYPVPSQEVCESGGEHFARIMNSRASLTETFLIKRQLMGPCWIRIRQPVASNAPVSWAKVEFHVDSPKRIARLDLVSKEDGRRPPPPVVSLSLKLKTVVNPKTHKSEIVSISAVCHKQVQLETASDESPKHMVQLSLIRPLDQTTKFPRDIDKEISNSMPQLRRETNERAMLSRLFCQIGQWDPDVIVGHNARGYDLEVLLTRSAALKVPAWSKIGRCRRSQLSSQFSSRKDLAIAEAMSGRLLCDTYLSAKELLRETMYSLTNLSATQLKTVRQEIEPVDIPQWFQSSKTIVQLALHTLFDAQLVQRLMFKLQVLPLTKQLTCIAGNIWSHTLKSNRAERTEYLLLHEFHRLKFLPPEKRRGKRAEKTKAKYSGGLVLEPKKGLYDSYILLLDFNSLYPSIIQEYNLCFTTIDWSRYNNPAVVDDKGEQEQSPELPPLPDDSVERGVLPRVIKSLVERRRAVKKILKTETNAEKKEELDIRQKALKLTANSMYGCLGFSNSRFFAQPIAAMVTAMGRETLQRTVDIAQNTVGLDVIYGDTDSIMINTRLNDEQDLKKVNELGERVKKEVNRLYKTLELEIDGIFRSMLLLKKKKYAAKTVEQLPNGEVKFGQELKGLDLVRRDWCVQSKDTGRYVTEQILSGQDSEIVVQNIFVHLEEVAKKMRSGELPLEKYVITKGLSKHPNDYPDGKSQPHVQVAKMMLKANRPVNTGDHIPYIITAPLPEQGTDPPKAKAASASERARHPEEIARSDGVLKPDVEWYLAQQILPPVARLCDPIEGTSQQVLAEKLGLDASRYNHIVRSNADYNDDDLVDYTPASFLSDEERFKDVEKLKLFCFACGMESNFPGVFSTHKDEVSGTPTLVSGLRCTNPNCMRPMFWGQANHFECYARIANTMSIWVRGLTTKYYEGLVRCDEPSCGLETRQLSVAGGVCLSRGCNGRMLSVDTERGIHTHLKYLETLFSADHACEQLEKKKVFGRKIDLLKGISKHDRATFEELHEHAKRHLESNAFNWISPSFWAGLFGASKQ